MSAAAAEAAQMCLFVDVHDACEPTYLATWLPGYLPTYYVHTYITELTYLGT
jgi:hypothetical protein